MDKAKEFCLENNIKVNELKYIKSALTHSTYAYENADQNLTDNERLEFLGDAVLQLTISIILYQVEPELDEGLMTKYRSLVVCEDTLTQVANDLDLGNYLYLGKGEDLTGGRKKPSNLSNAVEAVYGALYLDQGLEYVQKIIKNHLMRFIKLAVAGKLVYDFKSRLLELVQGTRGNSTMNFEIIKETGPVHERTFTAAVNLDDKRIAIGTGNSKKEAEQNAAKYALDVISCDTTGCILTEENIVVE
ncbi:MAG: ribonuclease III [Clostridiaceae bacterium]|nr:ribonuclease III [Clostridiaceae bacterium]